MKTKPIASTLLALAALLAVAAVAGPPVLPTLNPQPPSYYSCEATGSGAICRGILTETPANLPFGIMCGTAQNPVELLVSGTDTFRLTRYYDSAGNLARRSRHEDFRGVIVNPVTGLSATTLQISNFSDVFAIPGDFGSVTTQLTGLTFTIRLPGSGVLTLDAGRIALDAEENLLGETGRHDLDEYFSGNREVVAKLCAALGSPGTP